MIDTKNTEIVKAALDLASQGMRIVPVNRENKKPCLKTGKGHSAASSDPLNIRYWFEHEFPNANIAILTGSETGLLVVDLDIREKHNGISHFDKLLQDLDLDLPKTLTVETGSGGRHLYFKYPAIDQKIRSVSSIGGYLGVDIIASAHCLVVPPSNHSSGKQYRYVDCEKDPPDLSTDIAVLPDQLLQFILEKQEKRNGVEKGKSNKPKSSLDMSDHIQNLKIFKVLEGNRFTAHKEMIGELAKRGVELDYCLKFANALNETNFSPPWKPEELIEKTIGIHDYYSNMREMGTREIVDELRSTEEFLAYSEGEDKFLLKFNGKYWQSISQIELQQIARETYCHLQNANDYKKVYDDLLIASHRSDISWNQIKQHQIALKDYLYDCKTGERLSYTKEYYLRSIIEAANYDQGSPTPLWDKCLFDWFADEGQVNQEKIALLHEFIGYCLSSRQLLKKYLTIYGPPNTGKSLIGELLIKILGSNLVSTTKLSALSGDFGLARLPGKQLNIDDEPNVKGKDPLNESVIKKIISPESTIEINQKHKGQQGHKLYCKFLVLANQLPQVQDISGALFDRMLMLICENSIPEEARDYDLLVKLENEIPGIIAKAVTAFSDLVKRGYKFTRSASSEEALAIYSRTQNPVEKFLQLCFKETKQDTDLVSNDQIWELYKQIKMCKQYENLNLPDLGDKKISAELNKLGYPIKPHLHPKKKGEQIRALKGFVIKRKFKDLLF